MITKKDKNYSIAIMAKLIFTNPRLEGYSTEAILDMLKSLVVGIDKE